MSLLAIYRASGTLLTPLVRGHLARRAAQGKEDPARLRERLGHAARPRPEGRLCWLHAASVGEALSILPLIERLRAARPALTLLVTTGTVTSARLLALRLPPGVLHQYAPVDLPRAAARFLDHWRPDLALWTESELWPAMIHALSVRSVPLVLLNGRLSERSFRRWRRAGRAGTRLLGFFSLCLAQTEADAARFAALGANPVAYLGNLKFAAPPLPCDETVLQDLQRALGPRPCWLAASTHAGEEEIIAAAHRQIAAEHPDLLTLIVPRHPERGPEIARALTAAGFSVTRRGEGGTIGPQVAIHIADTIGELGLWYRLGGLAFVGGSLVAHGGQNPLEPARLDRAVLHGPGMANFADIAAGLAAAGGSRTIGDAAELARALEELLFTAPARRVAMAAAACRYASSEAEVLDRVLARLEPFLDACDEPGAGFGSRDCQG